MVKLSSLKRAISRLARRVFRNDIIESSTDKVHTEALADHKGIVMYLHNLISIPILGPSGSLADDSIRELIATDLELVIIIRIRSTSCDAYTT